MTLAPIQTQDIPSYSYIEQAIEYRVGVACGRDEELINGSDIFYCLVNTAMTSPVTSVKNRISEIESLPANWDGYNAVAPAHNVAKNAFKFVDALLAEGYNCISDDDVTPTPYGSIVLDVKSERGLVSIEIGDTMLGYFTEFIDGNDFSSEGITTDFRTLPDELKTVLDTLYGEQIRISA